jgi:C1A family cysteine protease
MTQISADIYMSMVSTLEKDDDTCIPILPFPKEHKTVFQSPMPSSIPTTFRFSSYKNKLETAKCSSVFSQYTTMALSESSASGILVKPRYIIAPMNTSITFFKTENIAHFSITNDEFETIQTHAAHLPHYYSWMDQSFILRPFNQGLCGSCWAVAAAMCLSDVFAVSKKVDTNPNLSSTHILSCFPQGQCNGGDPSEALRDMVKSGIAPSSCMNYDWCNKSGCSGDPLKHFDSQNLNQYIPPCKCSGTPISDAPLYFATEATAICIPPKLSEFSTLEATEIKFYLDNLYGNVASTNLDLSTKSIASIRNLIKYYIHTYGPMIGGFHVFKNFFKGEYRETNDIYVETCTYRGVPGINYNDVERDWVGSHAVVVVGWGEDIIDDEKVEYWVVRNSWGESWGKMGTFKMAMYGNDPNKKYQNRVSQFEYPSIINTDLGIGITGGMLMMKAGSIKNNIKPDVPLTPEPVPVASEPPKTHMNTNNTTSFIGFIIIIAFIIALYYIFRQKIDTWMIIGQTILLFIITGLLLQLTQKTS